MISPDDLWAVSPRGLIDLALFYGRWPFHRVATGVKWSSYIKRWHVKPPLASPLGAAFYKDPAEALEESRSEVAALEDEYRVRWIPVLNPALDGWQGDFERFLAGGDVPGFRLMPSYHGYACDCEAALECMNRIRDAGKVVFLQCRLEDERIQHAVFNCPPVSVKSAASALARVEGARAVVCGMLFNEAEDILKSCGGACRLVFELSYFKGPFRCCEEWAQRHGIANLGFGSMWPLLVPEAAIYRVMLAELDAAAKMAILCGNAAELLGEGGE